MVLSGIFQQFHIFPLYFWVFASVFKHLKYYWHNSYTNITFRVFPVFMQTPKRYLHFHLLSHKKKPLKNLKALTFSRSTFSLSGFIFKQKLGVYRVLSHFTVCSRFFKNFVFYCRWSFEYTKWNGCTGFNETRKTRENSWNPLKLWNSLKTALWMKHVL